MSQQKEFGKIGWIDLTVPDATAVCDFYEAVVGWARAAVPVDDYEDYCVSPEAGAEPVAGICHARGANAGMPTQWLMYVTIPNLDESLSECEKRGGRIVCPRRDIGSFGHFAVVEDPAGAVIDLLQPPEA